MKSSGSWNGLTEGILALQKQSEREKSPDLVGLFAFPTTGTERGQQYFTTSARSKQGVKREEPEGSITGGL